MRKIKLWLTLIGYFVLIAWLLLFFSSRFTFQKGIHFYRTAQYEPAMVCFDNAMKRLDMPVVRSMAALDLFRLNIAMGKALYSQAMEMDAVAGFHRLLKLGHRFLASAVADDPLDFRAVYWLAKTVEGLESAHPLIYPEGRVNPWNAGPLLEQAVRLRPNGITVHMDLANYLYGKGHTDSLPVLVRHMAAIYPPSISYLKKAPYYSDEIRKSVLEGLNIALKKGTMPWQTLTALSGMALEEGNTDAAISHYQAALHCNSLEKGSSAHLHMGRLLLKKQDFNTAASFFITVLREGDVFEDTMEQIFRQYKAEKQQAAFIRFTREVEVIYQPSESLDLLVARALMDMDRPELARSRLLLLSSREPSARGAALMARIAEKQKDWEQMELAAQQATMLDPTNGGYYGLFARALERQGNYFAADKVLSRGIDHADTPDPAFYNQRAWIRWRLTDFPGAIQDWQAASELQPKRSAYLFYIARAYKRMAQPEQALAFADRALELAPENTKYQKFRTNLISALKAFSQ